MTDNERAWYAIAEGDTPQALVEDANQLVALGYKPVGSVTFWSTPETEECAADSGFVQAFFLEAGAFIKPTD